jgi:hypothetical protein
MKTTLFLLSIVFSSSLFAKPGVIVAGDSWAFLPCLFGSVEWALQARQMDVEVVGCLKTSKAGARADNYKSSSAFTETLKLLQQKPNVKAVYLSLGGNDMFNYWSKDLSVDQENEVFIKIRDHIKDIVDQFHQVRPDVFVLINGYDFGFLYDNNPIKPYRRIFEHMGKPNALQANSGFIRFSQIISQLSLPQTAYIQHFGLMHYYFGAPEANLPAKTSLSPQKISTAQNPMAVGGVLEARNSNHSMARIFSFYTDPHHLSPTGFDYLVGHALDQYLANILGFAGAPQQNEIMQIRSDADITVTLDQPYAWLGDQP